MWLQLALTGVSLVMLSVGVPIGVAHGQDTSERSTEGSVRLYADDDHVTVISPSVSARFAASESLAVNVRAKVDAVSAASVDVITSASPTRMHELRMEANITTAWSATRRWQLRGSGTVSYESDYLSLRPTLGAQTEVADRNATFDVSYTPVVDSAGNANNSEFARKRRGHILIGGFTQVLDSSTYLNIVLEARHLKGYHASPYRRVPLQNNDSSALLFVEERTPTLRQSAVAMLQLRRAIGADASWFVHASYRGYWDSWRVASHTLSARVFHPLARERFLLGAHMRGYAQGAANFYQPYYETSGQMDAPVYRTRDRTLGGMHSLHGSLTADTSLGSYRLRTSTSITKFRFRDFPAQRDRSAVTLELSLRTAW